MAEESVLPLKSYTKAAVISFSTDRWISSVPTWLGHLVFRRIEEKPASGCTFILRGAFVWYITWNNSESWKCHRSSWMGYQTLLITQCISTITWDGCTELPDIQNNSTTSSLMLLSCTSFINKKWISCEDFIWTQMFWLYFFAPLTLTDPTLML